MKTQILTLLILLAIVPSGAQNIVSYDFISGSMAPTSKAVGVNATAVNITGSSLQNFLPFQHVGGPSVVVANPAFSPLTTTPAVAVINNQFFQFTVTPPAGSKLNLGALLFLAGGETADPMGWVVRSSIDNYAADLGTSDMTTLAPILTPFGISLPAAHFTGVTTPVTFRFYTYKGTSLVFADYDSLQLLGQVDAPPQVGVFSAKKITTSSGRVRLSGNAFDDIGIDRVTVGKKTARGKSSWKAKVSLKPGSNRVRVFATDVNGAQSKTVTIRIRRT